jgi:ATP-binding cassette subfamily F protein 1
MILLVHPAASQHFVDALSMDENPVEYLLNKYPTAGLKPEGMRAMLGRFGLSGQHHLTPICKLSGEFGKYGAV